MVVQTGVEGRLNGFQVVEIPIYRKLPRDQYCFGMLFYSSKGDEQSQASKCVGF